MLPIAIDVMSGDHEPREYVAGALRALADDPQLRLLLVGEPQLLDAASSPPARRACARAPRWCAASQVVTMEEKPREAIRRKKDSSMRVAIDLVHEGTRRRRGERRQHRRAHGDRALRAEDPARGRARRHHLRDPRRARPHADARSGRQHQGDPRAAAPVRRHGRHHRARRLRHRQPAHRPAQHRRGGHEGPRGGAGGARTAAARAA